MSRNYPDLINELAIIQGETYQELITNSLIRLPGNLTTALLRGQIRDDFLANSGNLLAEFEFEASVYDSATDETIINPYIQDSVTSNLAITTWREGRTLSVRNAYIYDIEAVSNGEVFKLAPGYIQVIGEVTDNSVIWNPPVIWDGSVDHVSLTATAGLTKIYTVWGDAAETLNLGTFTVEDGNGIVSASYSSTTGILTLTYEDGTTFNTGDIRGEQGIQGIQGIQGETGDSAYEVATNNGFVGTEQQWLDSLVGPQGEQGIQGDPGSDADLDAATIKTRYESNLDTNAYTDTEKAKLAGIATGAEVNVNADWSAVSGDAQILNKPTLDFEPADPTILKDADIGVTVQGYSANTVIDVDYGTVKATALSATQPGDLSTVATTGAYSDLSGLPTLGTAAATAFTDYATAAQGLLADSSVQPADLVEASRVIWVDPAGDDAAAGDLPTKPKRTITAALAAAAPGDCIRIRAGIYTEAAPMVAPRDVSLVGDGLRVTEIRPTPATAGQVLFLVDSGCYFWGLTFARHQAGSWAVAFNAAADNTGIGASGPGAYIVKSPYIQNCSSYTAEDDAGLAGSTSDGTTGGGMLVDGAACASNSPIRSMVVDSYTQVNLDGPGCLVTNDGYAQLVSFFGTFCSYHVKALNGGQVNLSNSTTNFGTFGLVADGRSTTALFSGAGAAAADGANQIDMTGLTTNRLGGSSRPALGQVFDVAGVQRTVTGASPISGGWRVTFFPALTAAFAGGNIGFFQRSQIMTGGQNMEFVGAGTNYLALPWNGGVPIQANEIIESNGGRVFYSTTDHLGTFRVGPQFSVDGTTGEVTISTDSFNVSGLNQIGPFSRDGGQTTVGVQLREVSNDAGLIASTGAADGNTVPTQSAVVAYVAATADIRDTNNRNRANHTGTQLASTISDFDTEVSNNTDVAANTLARHDAVTVSDSSEIDFTLTGQNVTASIVLGSIDKTKLDTSVNASLDLADTALQPDQAETVSGNYTFNGALILPNNSRINNVEHFYQTTKPTSRGDSSALVAGDRWWKTDDGTEWFWNGTYWVSVEVERPGAQYRFNSSQVRDSLVKLGPDNYRGGGSWLVGPVCYWYKSPSGGLFDADNYHRLASVSLRIYTPDYGGDYGIGAFSSGVNDSKTPQGQVVGPPMPLPTTSWQFYKETRAPSFFNNVSYFSNLSSSPSVIAGTPGEIIVVTYTELRKIYDD